MQTVISRIQLVYLLIWLILGTGLFILPSTVSRFTIQDAWIPPLLFAVCTVFLSGLFWGFITLFPGQNLTGALEQAFGMWIGRFAGLVIFIGAFILEATLSREINIFVDVTVFARVQIYLISAVFIIPVAVAAASGVEVIGRVAEFITPLAVTSILLLMALALINIDVRELQPTLADGFKPVWKASVTPNFQFLFQFVLTLQLLPSIRKPVYLPQLLLVAGFIIGILGAMTEVVVIGVLGHGASYLSFPVLETVRAIRIGQFLERFDTLYVMGLLTMGFLKMSFLLYLMSDIARSVFRLRNSRTMVWGLASACWAGGIVLFHNTADFQRFVTFTSPSFTALCIGGIPVVAMLIRSLRLLAGQGNRWRPKFQKN